MVEPTGRSPPPPPIERRESVAKEMTTVRLFNLMLEKTKLVKGYHSLSDKALQKKLLELRESIDTTSKKLSPDQLQLVREQIQKLQDDDLQE